MDIRTQGHQEDACPLGQATKKEDANTSAHCNSKSTKPKEESTYGSWMLIKKLAMRKSTRQQPHAGGRPSEEPDFNRQEGAARVDRTSVNPGLETNRGITVNEERIIQANENRGGRKESAAMTGEDHGNS